MATELQTEQGIVRVPVDVSAVKADVLVSVLADLHPGQKVPVKLLRHGKKLTVTVTLGELRG